MVKSLKSISQKVALFKTIVPKPFLSFSLIEQESFSELWRSSSWTEIARIVKLTRQVSRATHPARVNLCLYVKAKTLCFFHL